MTHPFKNRPHSGAGNAHADGQRTVLHSADLSKLAGGHLSHDEIAGKVRMLMRSDLDHEAVCTMARDRIKWLAHRVEVLEAAQADGWIPLAKDSLPADFEEVILYCPGAMRTQEIGCVLHDMEGVMRVQVGITSATIEHFRFPPTHWRPRMQPPAAATSMQEQGGQDGRQD